MKWYKWYFEAFLNLSDEMKILVGIIILFVVFIVIAFFAIDKMLKKQEKRMDDLRNLFIKDLKKEKK